MVRLIANLDLGPGHLDGDLTFIPHIRRGTRSSTPPKMLTTQLPPSKSRARPRLPDGIRIYAISDIHGCAHLLEQMFRVIDADVAHGRPYRAIEVYLGDYIDRGPESALVLDLLIDRSRRGNTVFLKGNHEAFLAEVFRDPRAWRTGFRSAAGRP